MHRNVQRIDGFRTESGYSKTPLSQYGANFVTTPGAVYEAVAHTEYISHGNQPGGEIDLHLEISGKAIARSTTTGNPLTQISRTVIGEFTATSRNTRIQAFITSDAVRTISIYPGYLRVMRVE